ncbi:hypothetical protein AAG570_001271 [Ranatra chinensis]|uniref:BUD13 homolog n=1 Tax=Ranatra chinensis TaxID=642074 RepID=A0ABD0YN32_9HEMI
MTTVTTTMSQKEYLQKYLSKHKKKKKKIKISSSSLIKRSQIIDDDIDDIVVKGSVDDDEFNLDYLGEEAPQIAGVVDERPLELRTREQYSSNQWKDIEEKSDDNLLVKETMGSDSDMSPPRKFKSYAGEDLDNLRSFKNSKVKDSPKNKYRGSSSDLSPPRKADGPRNKKFDFSNSTKKEKRWERSKRGSDSDMSPPRKPENRREDADRDRESRRSGHNNRPRNNYGRDSDSDMSPLRKSDVSKIKNSDSFRPIKKSSHKVHDVVNSDSDMPHPKKSDKRPKDSYSKKGDHSHSLFKSKEGSDCDVRPPKNLQQNTSDQIVPRSRRMGNRDSSDISKSKKKKDNQNDSRRGRPRRDSSSDVSPPRKSQSEASSRGKDLEHSRTQNRGNGRSEGGIHEDSDLSPPRKSGTKQKIWKDISVAGKYSFKDKSYDSNLSRQTKTDSRHGREAGRPKLMEKTLDGKKAGLQHANSLKEELHHLKQKEDQMFKEFAMTSTGEGMAPIIRDRATGKKRDLEKERQELKQIEDTEKRISDAVREMSKPLARYATDEDLENYLKAQEREGDPMLEFIRQKQNESIDLAQPSKQKYKGSFMPNRFGIAPGYRWDGVDRSSGYEKQWFETRNAKKAIEEEAYKWSTSDM